MPQTVAGHARTLRTDVVLDSLALDAYDAVVHVPSRCTVHHAVQRQPLSTLQAEG